MAVKLLEIHEYSLYKQIRGYPSVLAQLPATIAKGAQVRTIGQLKLHHGVGGGALPFLGCLLLGHLGHDL